MTAEFAIADETLNKFIDLYVKTRSQVMLLMPLIILLRVGWNFIKGSGPISFIEIIKDVFVCTALLFFFHQYIQLILSLPTYFAKVFDTGKITVNVDTSNLGVLEQMAGYFSNIATIFCYWLAYAVYCASLLILIAVAAYALFFFVMFGFYPAVFTYLGLLTFVGFVPIFWSLLNIIISFLFSKDQVLRNLLLIIIDNFAKLLVSLFVFKKALFDTIFQSMFAGISSLKQTSFAAKRAFKKTAELGANTVSVLGGSHYVEGVSRQIKGAKQVASFGASKTIPTAEKLIKHGMSMTPATRALSRTASAGLNLTKNVKDVYSGKEIPNSSPIRQVFSKIRYNHSMKNAASVRSNSTRQASVKSLPSSGFSQNDLNHSKSTSVEKLNSNNQTQIKTSHGRRVSFTTPNLNNSNIQNMRFKTIKFPSYQSKSRTHT